MFRISLNLKRPLNYAFFCPDCKIHLTLRNPVGSINRVTPAVLRGLRSKNLLDLDGAIDLTTGKLKQEQIQKAAVELKVDVETQPTGQPPIIETPEAIPANHTEDGSKKRRGSKRSAT